MEKTEKIINPVLEKVVPQPVNETKVQAKPVQVKRKRFGFKLLFILIVLVTFGSAFTVLGVYVAQTVLPSAQQWLADHNFSDYGGKNGQENSPFLPQPSKTANKNELLTIPQVVKKSASSVVSIAIVKSKNLHGSGSNLAIEANKIGTGFIVDANGIIVTNQHVVRDTTATYEVITQDNKTYKTKNIIRDEVNDIALLIIEAKNLSMLPVGESDHIEVGETVIAIGTPLGEFPGSVTVGVISGLGRSVKTGDGFWELQKEYENVLQTDAAINPGNSGGPLLNLFGEVIGVNFATTGGADNISFALPINLVKQKVAEYRQFGKFRSPYLGVNYRMVLAQEAEFYNAEPGALVRSIAENSPATKSGIKIGDIITNVNGKKVTTSLAASLAKYKVEEEITLTVFRSDIQGKSETVTLKVVLSDRPTLE